MVLVSRKPVTSRDITGSLKNLLTRAKSQQL